MAVKFDSGSSKNLTSGIPASTSSGSAGESAVVANNSDKTDVDEVSGSLSLKSETDTTSVKDDVVPPAEDA